MTLDELIAAYKMTLDELIAAYKSGELTDPLTIDNDNTYVYTQTGPDEYEDWTQVFAMHPIELLEQALGKLGIPHENA
jgi:hypothetical protein